MWINSLYNTTKLTIELRELVENGVNIWDFEYPSFYEGEEKTRFEQKVIDHYLFRQIGSETVGRWLHCFRTRIREIMPYYQQLYASVKLMESIEDPFEAYNLTETFTQQKDAEASITGNDTSSSSASNSGDKSTLSDRNATRRFSDTPHGSIDNLDTYMSEASIDSEGVTGSEVSEGTATAEGHATSETTSEDSEKTSYTLTRKGNIGVQPLGKEVQALRESYLNIDMMIINELKDLFLMVY